METYSGLVATKKIIRTEFRMYCEKESTGLTNGLDVGCVRNSESRLTPKFGG